MSKVNLLKVDKTKKYVLACSFGPDSMALLDLAVKKRLNIVVAHVNYHKRDASNLEQQNLSAYCSEKKIPLEILDTNGLNSKGNFQEWARELRYNFFKDVSKKYQCDAVLVAHQQDDVIETYLMQKNRKSLVKYPGIAEEIELFGIKILRPLLNFTKKQLQIYDDENNVPYSIDESNLTDHYSRNTIRHHVVEKMSEDERLEILEIIKKMRKTPFTFKTKYSFDEFQKLEYSEIVAVLDHFMNLLKEHSDISEKYINEIKKAFRAKSNMSFNITNSLLLSKSYNNVYIINRHHIFNYEFVLLDKFSNDFLEIDFSNGADDRGIQISDFPLTIKNLGRNDKIVIKNYTAQVKRLLIDWKMPVEFRKMWPGFYDKKGNLIYIPRYREKFDDNHKSILKINLSFLSKF